MYTFTTKSKTIFADLGLLFASIVWGTTFFIVKNLVNYINPVTLCAYRFLIAALILLPVLFYKKKLIFSNFKEGIILGIFLWLIYIFQTIGLVHTSASNGAFITGLFIVFIPVFSILLFKKMPSIMQLVSVFVALAGLWILTGGLREINKGDLITLITAIAYALHVLFTDKYVKNKIDPFILCFQQFLIVSILSFFVVFIFRFSLLVEHSSSYLVILYLIIFPTVIAFLIQSLAQKITTPIKVSLIFALEPLFGALFAWTLGREIFNFYHCAGGILIVLAIIISEANACNAFLTWIKSAKQKAIW